MQSLDSNNGKTFWKKSSKTVPGSMRMVYGAMHPPIIHSPKASPRKEAGISRKSESSSDSFQDFQASVNDAWNCDDEEFSVISDLKISNKVVQSTALSVIHNHRANQLVATSNAVLPNKEETSAPLTSSCVTTTIHNTTAAPPGLIVREREIITSGVERDLNREEKFLELIKADTTDLSELRKLSWSGVPPSLRADVWKLLSGYLPANSERRAETLKRKREEYWSFIRQYFDTRNEEMHHDTYRQIHIDIPRMSPLVPLFQQSIVQEMFERILYIWAIRHPASGYVQGINDLVTPFFIVFIYGFIPPECDLDTYEISLIKEDDRAVVEADSFWCMSKLLDGIQDNYTFAQPGIQNKVCQLRELTQRINENLHKHLERHEIDYLQFSFRWFNNLLMRELPLGCTIRLWDTLHAEPDGFSHFVLYVCAAFLTHFSHQLMMQKDFQSLMLLLQSLPTKMWSDNEISMIVAEAFQLKYVFADAPNHLHGTKK